MAMTSQTVENLGRYQEARSDRAAGGQWSLKDIVFVGAVGMGFVVFALSLAYPVYMHLFVYSAGL